MLLSFIIGPDWTSAIAAIVSAFAGVIGALVSIENNIIVVKGNKKQGHKPLFSWSNLTFWRRSSMRRVSKEARRLSKIMKEDEFFPTLIFFIGRGGAIFGSLISYNLANKPIYCVDRKYLDNNKVTSIFPIDKNIPKEFLTSILIVAGEAHTGSTINYFKEQFESLYKEAIIKTCAFYKQKSCKLVIDYIGRQGKDSILMPWQDADFIRESTINLD